jgi:uncharacterized protein YbaP (TraB family)
MRSALAAVIAIFLTFVGGPALASPAMWTVHGRHGVVVLFGSVHLLPAGLQWKTPALEAALGKAEDLWFEVSLDQLNDERAARLSARLGALPAQEKLWDHLTAAQRVRVERAAVDLGLDPSRLAGQKPWFAEISLELASDMRSGAVATEGVEARLQNEAPATARRHAFETVQEQLNILAGIAPQDQAASLEQTARDLTSGEDVYGRTVSDWAAGDLAGIQRDALQPLQAVAPSAYQRLIVDRNRRWVRVIARLAERPRLSVVVVGAGHLVGPDGLPALLRARGVAVDGP